MNVFPPQTKKRRREIIFREAEVYISFVVTIVYTLARLYYYSSVV